MINESYRKYYPWAAGVAFLLLVWLIFFSVRETEFVLVTQFGKPLYTVAEPGLHMKWPFQTSTYFDRRLRIYNPRPSEFLTRDKKNLVIESYVAWQIHDPKRFVRNRRRSGSGGDAPARYRLVWIVGRARHAGSGKHRFHQSPDRESRRDAGPV